MDVAVSCPVFMLEVRAILKSFQNLLEGGDQLKVCCGRAVRDFGLQYNMGVGWGWGITLIDSHVKQT